ncbi:hypothetical protein MPSEU_000896300 [Mayamaea pseudoterrestris]|nr:hypothetical protein MPSEU_000896300 [Mayamaea pseudoterrestris]
MLSVGVLSRSVIRQSAQKLLVPSRTHVARVGSTRWASSYFTPAHEYAKVDGKIATCGITDFAQAALGDIVFVDLPNVGDEFARGDSFGSVESVKAASDVYAAVSGKIVEVNNVLTDEPGLVNSEAENAAWFVKMEMSDESELSDLMTPEAYMEHCDKEAH